MTKTWSILCALLVLATWGIHSLFVRAGVDFTPLHWVGLILWLVWIFLGSAVTLTFLDEREPRAAGVSAAFFGAGAIVMASVFALLLHIF